MPFNENFHTMKVFVSMLYQKIITRPKAKNDFLLSFPKRWQRTFTASDVCMLHLHKNYINVIDNNKKLIYSIFFFLNRTVNHFVVKKESILTVDNFFRSF